MRLAIKRIANVNPFFHDWNDVREMAGAGCVGVSVGNEFGSDKTLEALKKGFRKDDVAKSVSGCKDLGMRVNCLPLLGVPAEQQKPLKKASS